MITKLITVTLASLVPYVTITDVVKSCSIIVTYILSTDNVGIHSLRVGCHQVSGFKLFELDND